MINLSGCLGRQVGGSNLTRHQRGVGQSLQHAHPQVLHVDRSAITVVDLGATLFLERGKRLREISPRADSELSVDLAQVIVDRVRA